jgi:tripartite-type tricarboxylate transporter receptor subunit TctC
MKFVSTVLMLFAFNLLQAKEVPIELKGKTITLVSPYGPGGNSDLNAREIAGKLTVSSGVTWVVVNRTGGNGSIGAESVMNAKPDGLTLCQCDTGAVHVNTLMKNKLNPVDKHQFQPIAAMGDNYWGIIVNIDAPYNNFDEFISYIKSNSNRLSYAVTGPMSIIWAEKLFQFEKITGLKPVLYRSEKDGLNDVLGKHLEFMITAAQGAAGPLLEAKKLKLAVLGSEKPQEKWSQVATINSKYPMTMQNFQGLYGPLGIPKHIVIWLNAVYTEALTDPIVKANIINRGNNVNSGNLDHALKIDQKYWNDRKTLVKDFGHLIQN